MVSFLLVLVEVRDSGSSVAFLLENLMVRNEGDLVAEEVVILVTDRELYKQR